MLYWPNLFGVIHSANSDFIDWNFNFRIKLYIWWLNGIDLYLVCVIKQNLNVKLYYWRSCNKLEQIYLWSSKNPINMYMNITCFQQITFKNQSTRNIINDLKVSDIKCECNFRSDPGVLSLLCSQEHVTQL